MLSLANYNSTNLTTNATTTILNGIGPNGSPGSEGVLGMITIGAAGTTALTITVYDATSATGTPISTITVAANAAPVTLSFMRALYNGLTVVTAGGTAASVTVLWK
jgi:hypothetical protein